MTFALLIIAALCVETAMCLPMGSLPMALEQEGVANKYIALAMGAGMLTMVIASIPLGALVDKIGRVVTMRLATVLALMALIGLGLTHGAVLGGILISVRSIAVVGYMTAQAAYVSVLVSKARAVSAVATMGIVGSLAFATAPAVAVWLWQHGCCREQYLWATAIIALGCVVTWFFPRDIREVHHPDAEKPKSFNKIWLPALLFGVCASLQGGVNMSLAVLAFHDRGITNGAALFTASALTAVVLRYPAGRFVETTGARKLALPMAIMQGIGCVMAANAYSLLAVVAAGIVLGAAWSALIPFVLAMLFAESDDKQRGAVMGAFNFALGLGFTLGSGLAAYTSAVGGGYWAASIVCAVAPLVALPILLMQKISEKKQSAISHIELEPSS